MKYIIKDTVKKLIKKYHTRDPFELAELLKIELILCPLHEEINGLYQYEKRVKFIYVNSSLSDSMQRLVCAHELGHAVLHTKLNCTFLKNNTLCNINRFETEANRFACDLIIPDDLISQYPNYFNLEQIAASEGLPIELLELKFKDLSIF